MVSILNAFENDIVSGSYVHFLVWRELRTPTYRHRLLTVVDNAKTALTSTNATDFWIGASDLVTTGKWAWTDSSNFLYTNWAPGRCGVVEVTGF